MQRSHVVALLILVTLAAGVFFYSRTFLRVPEKQQNPQLFSNAYSLVLKDYESKDVHLYEYRRKVLIAYAWASWCTYCGEELKNLAKLRASYGDQIDIVAINRGESAYEGKGYIERLVQSEGGADLKSMIDFIFDPGDEFFKTISGYAMPETVFINEKGDIIHHQRGPIKIDEVEQKIKELIQ